MPQTKIKIEVAYAIPSMQKIIQLEVEEGFSIEEAILQSGILAQFPEIDLQKNKVGIFSQIKNLTDEVKEGDRIEIYRPLMMDPKEARRKRALSNKKSR